MPDSARTDQIKVMIRKHLQDTGGTRWKDIRLRFPDISNPTFWRYVKAVREEANIKAEAAQPAGTPPNHVIDDGAPLAGKLPAFYNPMQKARLYESLLADAELMRLQAVDHRGRITNWRMFDKSIQLRERLVCQQAEMMNFFQDQEAIGSFLAEVSAILEELPPELAHRFIDRLRAAHDRRFAKPSG